MICNSRDGKKQNNKTDDKVKLVLRGGYWVYVDEKNLWQATDYTLRGEINKKPAKNGEEVKRNGQLFLVRRSYVPHQRANDEFNVESIYDSDIKEYRLKTPYKQKPNVTIDARKKPLATTKPIPIPIGTKHLTTKITAHGDPNRTFIKHDTPMHLLVQGHMERIDDNVFQQLDSFYLKSQACYGAYHNEQHNIFDEI